MLAGFFQCGKPLNPNSERCQFPSTSSQSMDVSKQRWIVRLERGLRRICWSQLDQFGLLYPVGPQGGQIDFEFALEEHL